MFLYVTFRFDFVVVVRAVDIIINFAILVTL